MNRFQRAFLLAVMAAAGARANASAAEAPFMFDAREPDPTWELDSTLRGTSYSIQYPQVKAGGNQEGLNLDLTQFLSPLRDDGSPYSLRPYLQRTSALSLAIDFGHFATHNPFGGPDRTSTDGGVGGSLDIYLKRWLVLTGHLGYGYDVLHDVDVSQKVHTVSGGAGLGFRAADWRADVAYSANTYHPSGSSWASLRQFASLSLFGVIARRYKVSLSGNTVPGGGTGEMNVEYFPSPEVGIFGGASASTGRLYESPITSTRYAGSVGIAGWVDSSSGIVGSYTRAAERVPMQVIDTLTYGSNETSNEVVLEVYIRFP